MITKFFVCLSLALLGATFVVLSLLIILASFFTFSFDAKVLLFFSVFFLGGLAIIYIAWLAWED